MNGLAGFEYSLRKALLGGASVSFIELDSEISVLPTGVVACRQQNATNASWLFRFLC